MKKVCFVVSHLGSGSESLVAALNATPRCQFMESNAKYDGLSSARWLFKMGHKCRDASAVYGDHLLFNASVTSKSIYGAFSSIFVIRPARHSLNQIIKMGYSERGAASYYRFRLRRMCEMAKRSPGAVLITWEDLARESTMNIIEDYLNIPDSIETPELGLTPKDLCSESCVEECQGAYERYSYYLSGLNLRRPK